MLSSVLTTSPQILGQMVDEFWLNVRKRYKFSFYRENNSSPWTGRLLFRRSLLKMFNDGPIFFNSLSENEEKNIIFFSNLVSSTCSFGQVECNFDNRYKNILRERRELFTPCPKTIPNSKFFKTLNFSPTCSSAHVECNFDNSWKNFGSRPKNFVQLPKTIEEAQFFGKFFPKLVPMDRWNESTLGNPIKIFKQKAENLRSLSKNEEGNKTWWEVFFPRIVPMVTLKAIWLSPLAQVPRKAEFITADVR